MLCKAFELWNRDCVKLHIQIPFMEVPGQRRAIGSDVVDAGLHCDLCLSDDEQTNAEFYCSQCEELLCGPCARAHRKSKTSKHHQLLDRNEMPRRKLTSVENIFCSKHDGKMIEFYCNKHERCCCSVCITLGHSQCGAIYIGDVAKWYNTSQEYRDVLQSIKHLEKHISDSSKISQNNSDTAKRYFDELVADVRQFRTEINDRLDVLEKEIKMEAEKIQSEDLKAAKSFSALCTDIGADLSKITSSFTSLEKYRQYQQLFICTKRAQVRVREMQHELKKWSQNKCSIRYTFQRNENTLKTLELSRTLGTLEFKGNPNTNTQADRSDIQHEVPKGETSKPSKIQQQESKRDIHYDVTMERDKHHDVTMDRDRELLVTEASFVESINVKQTQDQRKCWITGTVQINARTLAVVDWNNKSVKIVDINSNKVTTHFTLKDEPLDITYMNDNILVVTCDTCLLFLQYDGRLTLVKKVPMECSGITSYKRKLFISCQGIQPSVKILSDKGDILQTIQHDKNGQNLFVRPKYIALSKDGQTMFVSDSYHHSVTSLSLAGNVCHTYRRDGFKNPLGLTVDDKDNVFVASCASDNIHQITPQCTPVQIVIQHDARITKPQTVLYSTTSNSLYVSTGSLSSHLLHVYKLK